jgi:thiosulfate dehydrogenase (quinone) large subunit
MQEAQRGDGAVAYLLLRVMIGVNIFMHGATRIAAGVSAFAAGLVGMFHQTPLPPAFVHAYGVALPWLEALIGLLVLVGAQTRWALIAGFLLMLSLTFGVSLRQDWQTAGLQLTYGVVYAILLAFRQYNLLSVDALLAKRS